MARNFGMLTVNNLEEVANRVYEFLKGKRYTFVAVNSFFGRPDPVGDQGFVLSTNHPEVRTNQYLSGPPSVWYEKDTDNPSYRGFNFGDTYGSWGLCTATNEPQYDPSFNNPYYVIDYVTVRFYHRAPAGHFLAWVFAIDQGS